MSDFRVEPYERLYEAEEIDGYFVKQLHVTGLLFGIECTVRSSNEFGWDRIIALYTNKYDQMAPKNKHIWYGVSKEQFDEVEAVAKEIYRKPEDF